MAYKLVVGQSVNLHVVGVDGAGNHISPASTPVWTTSHPTKVSLVPSPDGTTCTVLGLATQDGVTVTATIDALDQDFSIDVVTNLAVSLAIFSSTNPGNIDERQKSASGRYLGLGFNSPPNQ
jgi:hypothetical protein